MYTVTLRNTLVKKVPRVYAGLTESCQIAILEKKHTKRCFSGIPFIIHVIWKQDSTFQDSLCFVKSLQFYTSC